MVPPGPVRRIQMGHRYKDSVKVYRLLSFPLSRLPPPCSDPEIRSNILKSLLLNMLSLTSIYTFDLMLQPLVHDHPSWLHRNVGWFYRVLWLLPVIGVSFYLNVSATFPV